MVILDFITKEIAWRKWPHDILELAGDNALREKDGEKWKERVEECIFYIRTGS